MKSHKARTMQLIQVGVLVSALIGGYFAYQSYQGREREQDHKPEAEVVGAARDPEKLSPITSSVISKDLVEKKAEDDTAAYREIDQLKGQGSDEAVDALLKYLDHPNNWVKAHTLKALREIGSPRALTRVVALLDAKGNELVIRGAYMAIGSIGPKLSSPEERHLAINGLKKSLDLYRDGTDSESRGNMYALIKAAGKIPGPEAGEFLLAELPRFHELPHVQYSIIKALGETKYKPAEEALKQFRADLTKEGPEPWADKERYSDLLKEVDKSISLIIGENTKDQPR